MPLATRNTPPAPIAIVSNVLRFMVGSPAIRAVVRPRVADLVGAPALGLRVFPLLGPFPRRRAAAEPHAAAGLADLAADVAAERRAGGCLFAGHLGFALSACCKRGEPQI